MTEDLEILLSKLIRIYQLDEVETGYFEAQIEKSPDAAMRLMQDLLLDPYDFLPSLVHLSRMLENHLGDIGNEKEQAEKGKELAPVIMIHQNKGE